MAAKTEMAENDAEEELEEEQSSAEENSMAVKKRMRMAPRGRRKRRKKKAAVEVVEDGHGGVRQDPLEVFGTDIMIAILSNLDARSLALTLLVSRAWHRVSSRDCLWSVKCEELLFGKAHIPRIAQVQGLSKLAAYSLAIIDGKRTRISKYDLCDHSWEFHFSKAAPEYWRNLDPYWRGTSPLMRRYFHLDGSQSADPSDQVWGGHECCYCIVTSIIDGGKIREHYVRINRWPQMIVSRNEDWSWGMSNSLYCYSSVPDVDQEGGTGPPFLLI